MKTKQLINWPLYGLVILITIIVVQGLVQAQSEQKDAQRNYYKAFVYSVCNQARQEDNGRTEEACGQAQDNTNTEFLCEAHNSFANTKCWVEAK